MSLKEIKKVKAFEALNDSELAEIDKLIIWNTFPKDFSILSHRELSNDIYFIASGVIKATTFSYTGKEIAYQNITAGEMFGEVSAIDGKHRTTNVLAIESCVIGKMSSTDFWEVIKNHHSISAAVLTRLTGMVRFLCERVYEYGALGVSDRIRSEILKCAEDINTNDKNILIDNMPTHEEIANRVSTHREAVTKEFSRLYKEGYLIKEGKTIVIPDAKRLKALIEETL